MPMTTTEPEPNKEPKPGTLQGLYLVEPHGRLIADRRKTLIAKSKHLPLEGTWSLVSKENGRGLEYGKITVGEPKPVAIDKFDSLFKYHRVTPKERSRWWPTKVELYLYPITNLEPHDKPKLVEVPAGTQTIMPKIKYLSKPESKPEPEPKLKPDREPGQDRERPYTEVGSPRASDTHSDPDEKAACRKDRCMKCDEAPEVEIIWADGRGRAWFCKECFTKWKEEMDDPEIVKQRQVHSGSVGDKYGEEPEPEHERKEARMPWTTANPPSCAKNWTESEKKKCITAANAVLREGGKEQDAIFACIRAAGKTKYPSGKKAQDTESTNGFLTLQSYLESLGLDGIMVKAQKARGEGQGVGGPPQGDQGAELCVCPKCGHETKHERGTPCNEIECPECGAAMQGKPTEEAEQSDKAGKTVASTNDLPDSAFLHVEPGGKKDESGKTVPRSLRHLPYKNMAGGIDLPRLRNALSRLGQPRTGQAEGERWLTESLRKTLTSKAQAILAKTKPSKKKLELEPGEPTDDKGGRRLQSEKLSLLSSLKEKFESLLKDLGELIGWASYDDKKPAVLGALFKESSGYVANKALDGRTWLLTWTTNAFEDREGEIFTTKSIEDYVARHADDGVKGKFDFWHLPGTEFGTIMWQGVEGRFLIESGPFDDTEIGRKAEEFFLAHPNGHSEFAPEGWGTSHKYKYREGDRRDGVYDWFEKTKTTILPFSAAANQHNPQQLEVMTVDAKQLEALTGIWGPEVAAQIIALGKQQTEAKEKDGVAFKSVEGTEKTEDTEQKQDEKGEEDLTKNKELVQTVAEELQLGELSTAFKAIGNVVAALAEQTKALGARVETLEQDDEVKLAKKETQLPRYSWFKASTAAETVLSEDDALKSVKPSAPSVVQNIAGKVT